jgi:hypothetical protein
MDSQARRGRFFRDPRGKAVRKGGAIPGGRKRINHEQAIPNLL